jgi:hypothetical protein
MRVLREVDYFMRHYFPIMSVRNYFREKGMKREMKRNAENTNRNI